MSLANKPMMPTGTNKGHQLEQKLQKKLSEVGRDMQPWQIS